MLDAHISVEICRQRVRGQRLLLTVGLRMLLVDGVLRLYMMRISTQQYLYLVHIATLVIAELPLHALLHMRALRMYLIASIVNLVDTDLGGLWDLLLAATASLQTNLVVRLVDVSGLLDCRDGSVRLRLHLAVVLVDKELLAFVVHILVLLSLQVVVHVHL